MLIAGILKKKGDAVAAVGPEATIAAAAKLLGLIDPPSSVIRELILQARTKGQ